MLAEARDWQGTRRRYLRVADRRAGATLRALVAGDEALDPEGVRAAWGQHEAPARTWLRGVRQVPPGARLAGWTEGEPRFAPAPLPAAGPLGEALVAAVAAAAARLPDPMIALGGGLDAALVVALWRATGRALPEALTLQTGLPGYDESARAQAIADALGLRLHRLRIAPDALTAALPEAIAHLEQPLYNLHPVSRLLLAREAARLGARTLVTGDGADQAARGVPAPDYLPLVAALTAGAGLALWSPFLEEAVIAAQLAAGPDPGKAGLRALGRALGVPEAVAAAPKVPQLAPPLSLDRHVDRPALTALAAALGRPLSLATDREAVGWVTLALARRCLAAPAVACAE